MNRLECGFLSQHHYSMVATGSKEELIHAGYATADMFPRGSLRAQRQSDAPIGEIVITRIEKGVYELIWMPPEPETTAVTLPYHLAAVALRLAAWADCDLTEGGGIAPEVTADDIAALSELLETQRVSRFTPELCIEGGAA